MKLSTHSSSSLSLRKAGDLALRYSTIFYVVLAGAAVSGAVLYALSLFALTNPQANSQSTTQSFDQETIDNLKQDSQKANSNQSITFPPGKINPFKP